MPEASVMRRVRALSGFTGCKELRRRFDKFLLKSPDLIGALAKKLSGLSRREGAGTDCVAVKCVDIVGNTKGIGRHLAFY